MFKLNGCLAVLMVSVLPSVCRADMLYVTQTSITNDVLKITTKAVVTNSYDARLVLRDVDGLVVSRKNFGASPGTSIEHNIPLDIIRNQLLEQGKELKSLELQLYWRKREEDGDYKLLYTEFIKELNVDRKKSAKKGTDQSK